MLSVFLTAFIWGIGLSAGIIVGLIVWSFIKPVLPIDKKWLDVQERSLDALTERNDIGSRQLTELTRIANSIELYESKMST